MTTKVQSLPKFPQAGWAPPAARRLAGWTKGKVAKLVTRKKGKAKA